MAKKRNRRTRKKYKKRGGASDTEMKACNTRLKEQGIGMVKRRNMCIETDGKAGLKKVEEPQPEPVVQPVAQQVTNEPEPEQPSGVESVIAPLEEESSKPSIKDRASALEKQFGKTGMRKTRKKLNTTVGSCRAAVDEKGRKYYYNEAEEVTWDHTDEICHPKDGIEKTGNKSGECLGARYKGGEEYWYHPLEKFSTHNKDHPKCHPSDIVKINVDEDPIFPSPVSIVIEKDHPEPNQITQNKSKKEEKAEPKECGDYKAKHCPTDKCMLEPKITARRRLKIKNNKKLKRSMRKCLDKLSGGRKTKRKNKRKKRKKSRKRRK